MSLVAIFTAPKPFTNPHIATIQRNAILSWKALGLEVEIWLVGEEEGVAEVAAEFGVGYLPNVERNVQGTPRIDSIFNLVRQSSQAPQRLPGCFQAGETICFQAGQVQVSF